MLIKMRRTRSSFGGIKLCEYLGKLKLHFRRYGHRKHEMQKIRWCPIFPLHISFIIIIINSIAFFIIQVEEQVDEDQRIGIGCTPHESV